MIDFSIWQILILERPKISPMDLKVSLSPSASRMAQFFSMLFAWKLHLRLPQLALHPMDASRSKHVSSLFCLMLIAICS
jgi:hypothetical protein